MEKINVAELLKNCPKGMELDCTMYDNVTLDCAEDSGAYPIKIETPDGSVLLDKYGCYSSNEYAKCVIFPKGKTTWEGFVPPCKFKDGDIVAAETDLGLQVFILQKAKSNYKGYCYIGYDFVFNNVFDADEWIFDRLATEEEKEKFFQAIKDNGYKWNAETKTLEKLVKPIFKVGDIVRSKNCRDAGNFTIVKVGENKYSINLKNYCIEFKDQDNYELVSNKLVEPKFKVGDKVRLKPKPNYIYTIHCLTWDDNKKLAYKLLPKDDKHLILVSLDMQDKYELVPNKFDINTLVPFESKVLIRDGNTDKWKPNFWGFYNSDIANNYPYECCGDAYQQCIPYEGNEHLLGKTDDCDDFYKTWE